MIRLIALAVAIACAAAAVCGHPVRAASPKAAAPRITSITLSATSLPSTGGTVHLMIHAARASTCEIVDPAKTLKLGCTDGTAQAMFTMPANPSSAPVRVVDRVVAIGAGGSATRTFTVTEAGRGSTQAPAPPVVNLHTCAAGAHCFYGPITATYPTYGNVAPNGLGDCTFAAAADWEQVVLHRSPDPTTIGYEFGQAGGTTAGLPIGSLWTYWQNSGIDGVFLDGIHPYKTDRADVENGVRRFGAMVIELRWLANDGFAQYRVGAGNHAAIVDGFTPLGPLVVSWGETLQMTWQQWNAEVTAMYGIATQ